MQILLTGFMGSGKSTLLAKLAGENENHFLVDLDDYICDQQVKQSISAIIEKTGWQGFRQFEAKAISNLLKMHANIVISLGGAPLSDELRLQLNKQQERPVIVWLNTCFETCWENINKESLDNRPLARRGKEYLKELFTERSAQYGQCDVELSWERQKIVKNFSDFLSCIE